MKVGSYEGVIGRVSKNSGISAKIVRKVLDTYFIDFTTDLLASGRATTLYGDYSLKDARLELTLNGKVRAILESEPTPDDVKELLLGEGQEEADEE